VRLLRLYDITIVAGIRHPHYRGLRQSSPRTTITAGAQGSPNRGIVSSLTPTASNCSVLKRRSSVLVLQL
jgi:hypothetical protein